MLQSDQVPRARVKDIKAQYGSSSTGRFALQFDTARSPKTISHMDL